MGINVHIVCWHFGIRFWSLSCLFVILEMILSKLLKIFKIADLAKIYEITKRAAIFVHNSKFSRTVLVGINVHIVC